MKKLEKYAFKVSDILLQLYLIVTFLLIGANLAFIIYYQFINYNPQAVIVACVSLFVVVYTNKESR